MSAGVTIGLSAYLAFLGVSLLVICTPGQDTALTIRNTLAGRTRAGIGTAAGVAAGQAIWTVATSAGLSALLRASEALFLTIRLAGAAYLVYLGIRALGGALRIMREQLQTAGEPAPLSVAAAFRQGVVSNLSNAKMVAFFTSLLPQFGGAHPTFPVLLVLGLTFSLMTFAWLTGYAVAVERMNRFLRRPSIRRGMEGLLGAVLVGLGLRVGAEALRA
jgi:threonine/homoserine/homoserine lactone efflux protein